MHTTYFSQALAEGKAFALIDHSQATFSRHQESDMMDICPKTPTEAKQAPSVNDVS